MSGPICRFPVIEEGRTRACGAPTTTTREVGGVTHPACERCATALDAKIVGGALPRVHDFTTPEGQAQHDAAVRARWDAEQAKLPLAERRTFEQAIADDEGHLGRRLRRGRDTGVL